MTRRYIAARETVAGEEQWTIREYYPDLNAWTPDAMEPFGKTIEDLAYDIALMLDAVEDSIFLDLDADPPITMKWVRK
jgi:hypothetical protein